MPKEIILAMDSSGGQFSAGITDGTNIYTAHHSGIKQEQFFLPVIEKVLSKAQARLTDIKQVFFVRGPGRFTGIRISITFASMLQMLNKTEVSSATLFEILHRQVTQSLSYLKWQTEHPTGHVAVVLHAFREEYFLQIFDKQQAGPRWLAKDELLSVLSVRKEPLYIAGTDKENASLVALLGDKYRLAPLADSRLRIQTLLELAKNPIYKQNALEPLYLKPARFELGR